MQRIVDPQQSRMFDPFDPVLTEKTRARLLDGWPGVFRHVILELMPVNKLGEHYSPDMGRPTKELYSMAGLIFLAEFLNWTKPETLDAYSFRMDVHYALNMEPVTHDISIRTLERYIVIFEEDALAKKIMHDVTIKLAELLEINIDKQRLDSTHIFSDMASFGRTRLMGVAIKRFLAQVPRHDPSAYAALPESLRQRYSPSAHQMFGDTGKDKESRRLLRQQVAEDMHFLIGHFADTKPLNNGTCYKAMERIFYEQCEVHEEKVTVKGKVGSRVMQNPSDADATYDGHKGPGYQLQIPETCDPANEVQIITAALPQTAAEPDTEAVEPVLDRLEDSRLLPKELFVDTSYASDENVQKAEARGVELVGPVPGCGGQAADNALTIDDFNIDEATEQVVCCPAGHEPVSSIHDPQTGKTRTVIPDSACGTCDHYDQCPATKKRNGYQLDHTAKQRRTASRRREEATQAFRERYKIRGGIEGTNSGLKRRTGLGRLRVRGGPRVFHAIYLKVAGWNILRASVSAKMREIVHQRANMAVMRYFAMAFSAMVGRTISLRGPVLPFKPLRSDLAVFFRLPVAA
jgi:hypothetical protein